MLLGELHSQYEQMLQNHGVEKSVNRTRLKDNILEQFPEAQEHFDGKQF